VPDKIRVLVVDDHEMVAQSLRRVLGAEDDIDVIATAATVKAALEAAVAYVPDVILMDYLLPDGDGVAATAAIRALVPDVKVVLLTGSDVESALPGALEAGCVGFLEKTSALDKLVPAVRAVASGEVSISAANLSRLTAKPMTTKDVLSPREYHVLSLVAEGLSNKAIAARLTLSIHTVRNHVQTLLTKLDTHSKLEAVAVARRQGLLGPR
jgi:DNA-binding NarL/FixJ family response regulator